jgi:hypothetical protein
MLIATIVIGLAALGGAVMLGIRMNGKPYPPIELAVLHGLLVLAGIGVLVQAIASGSAPLLAQYAAAVFGIAAVGGLVLLFGFHLRKRPLPIPLIILHAAVGAVGLVLLIIAQLPRETG